MRLAVVIGLVLLIVVVLGGPARSQGAGTAQLTPTSAAYLPIVQRPLPTPTATETPEPTETPTTLPTITPTERPGLPKLKNPGFEQGHIAWVEKPGGAVIQQFPAHVTPHSGDWLADLGGESQSTDEIQQVIKLPAAPVYLKYYRLVDANIDDVNDFIVTINTTVLRNESIGYNTDTRGQWQQDSVDLSTFAGQTVLIQLRVQTTAAIHVYLDDMSLSSNP
jgi:hypothetical protein